MVRWTVGSRVVGSMEVRKNFVMVAARAAGSALAAALLVEEDDAVDVGLCEVDVVLAHAARTAAAAAAVASMSTDRAVRGL
jgi:hypothetical protein